LLETSGIRDGSTYRSRHNRSATRVNFAISLSPNLTGYSAMHTGRQPESPNPKDPSRQTWCPRHALGYMTDH
jgi:hypothetical protein